MPSYQSPETQLPSNVVMLAIPAPIVPPQWTYRGVLAQGARSIAASATAFITVAGVSAAPQKIYRSTDGITWALISTSINISATEIDVGFGNGVFIVACGGPAIARSTDDGLTWASPSTPFSGVGLVGVAYKSGTWLLLSNGVVPGSTYYGISTDGGLTWTLPGTFTTDLGFDLSSVISDGSQFIAVCSVSGAATLATSPDGITWTANTPPPHLIRNARIAYSGNAYVSGNSNSPSVRVASTVAGLAAAPDTLMPFADARIQGVAYANGHFIAAGSAGSLALSADNGVTWNLNILNFPGTHAAEWFAYVNSTYAGIGTASDVSTYSFVGPPAALAAGYTVLTFGPGMTLDSNWFPNAFFLPVTGGYAQNGDGIYLDGTGNGYGICTAQAGPGNTWTGKAFGGGGYFEAVLSFPPSATSPPSWPAFWSSSIETLAPNAVTSATQWPGQATGYGNWIEPDIFEMDASSASHYGIQMHAWHGTIPGALDLDLQLNSNVNTGAANLNTPNKYGFLWVPATPGVPGSGRAQWFFNDVQVGGTVVWDPYDSSLPPPPVVGASGGSILDKLHLALIANTNTTSPMTIQSVSVWQASDAMNLTSS